MPIVKKLIGQLSSPDFFEREEFVLQLSRAEGDDAVSGLIMALEDEDRGIRELAADHLVGKGGSYCTGMLVRYLSHEDHSVRDLAADILVRIGPDAVGALSAILDDAPHSVRKCALEALGLIGDASVAERVSRLLDDDQAGVACAAAETLGHLGDVGSVPHLLRAFEMYPFLRPQASEALGRIGDPSAFHGLNKYLGLDDAGTLYSVIEALGRLRHPEAVAALLPFLDHPDPMIADGATAAILRLTIGSDRSMGRGIPRAKLKNFLINSLSSNDSRVLHFALAVLYKWPDPEIAEDLLDFLRSAGNEMVRPLADVLKSYGDTALDCLNSALVDASEEESRNLLTAAARIAHPHLCSGVASLAEAKDPDIRAAVAYSLGHCCQGRSNDTLNEMAGDEIDHVRATAVKALGWIGSEESIGLITARLNDQSEEVRQAALGALILIGGDRAIEAFSRDLRNASPRRQRLAATVLGMIGEDATRSPLTGAVGHADPDVRRAAVDALCRIGHPDDIETIRSALDDPDALVRKSAVSALADLLGPEAVRLYEHLLHDEDIWVRYHVIDMVGSLGQDRFSHLVAPFLDDRQDILKIVAVKALTAMDARNYRARMQELSGNGNDELTAAVERASKILAETNHGEL